MAIRKKQMFEDILFPTDFSDASVLAAAYALNLARSKKARLHVIHVLDTEKEAAGFYVPHISFEKLDKEMLVAAREMLKKFCAKHFKGVKNLEQTVAAGMPHKEILKAIKSTGADVVVMGTFGKAGLERFLIGSTTERVMRNAGCPVLIIPPGR